MDANKAKELLNAVSTKKSTKTDNAKSKTGMGWEISAYTIRAASVSVPAVIVMCMENSWLRNGLGLMATVLIIALLIIFKEPIKKASGYAPGVIPFAIFVTLAIFFDTSAKILLTVGISGLSGSIIAIPFHVKYLSYQQKDKSRALTALENIADSLK